MVTCDLLNILVIARNKVTWQSPNLEPITYGAYDLLNIPVIASEAKQSHNVESDS